MKNKTGAQLCGIFPTPQKNQSASAMNFSIRKVPPNCEVTKLTDTSAPSTLAESKLIHVRRVTRFPHLLQMRQMKLERTPETWQNTVLQTVLLAHFLDDRRNRWVVVLQGTKAVTHTHRDCEDATR
jgi:hypothetical protein